MKQTDTTNKKKKILGIAVGIVAFGLSLFAVQQLFFKAPSIDNMMLKVASELNKSCPIMVDQYTRLDNVIALPDKIFQYNYSLVTASKADISLETVKQAIEPMIVNNVKTNPDLKIFRDNKTTLVYYYKDKDGVFAFKVTVTPDMYN